MRWFSGIRVQLLALILLTGAPLVGFIVADAARNSQREIERATLELRDLVEDVALYQRAMVREGRDLLAVVATALDDRGVGSPGCGAMMRKLRALDTGGWRFFRADRDGWLVCSGDGRQPYNIADQAHFVSARDTGEVVVGTYAPFPYDGSATLPIARALHTAGGQFDGVVVAAASVAWLDDLLDELILPPAVRVQVVDRFGNLLGDRATEDAPALAPSDWLVDGLIAPGNRLRRSGELLLATSDIGGIGLYAVAARSRADVVAAPRQALMRNLVAALAVVLVGGLVASGFAERRIAGRIRRLAAVAQRLSQGDLTARSQLPHERDELGDLANAFDRMASDLQRQHGSLAAREAEFRHLALHDPLTGLTNRRGLCEVLDHRLAAAGPSRPPFALLLIDLDGFKAVNDRFGHDKGDALLTAVAERLRSTLRARDVISRLAGDEFAVLLNGDPETGFDFAPVLDRLTSVLAEPYALGGDLVHCPATVGVAVCPTHGMTTAALLKAADVALYAGKAAGRRTWRLFEPGSPAAAIAGSV